jgi:ABC-2 type transport system permease protein
VARDKLWIVFAREYLERVRTRWFVIATVFGPVLFGVMFFLPPWLAARSKASADLARITVLDATGVALGKRVAAELNGGIAGDTARTVVRAIAPERLADAESTAAREVLAKSARGYLVLDSATLAGRSARYVGVNATAMADMQEMRRIVRDQVIGLRLERAGLDPVQSAAITNLRVALDAERISDRGRGASGTVSMIFAIGLAMFLYMAILFYGQAILRSVIEEKHTRVAEVVISSVSPGQLLGGKVLGVGAVGLTQMVIWIGLGFTMAKLRAPILAHFGVENVPLMLPGISIGAALVLLLYFVLGYVFYAALFAIVGSTVSNEQDAQQAQMPVTLLLVLSVLFLGPLLSAPEGPLARVLGWLPFSAPIIMPLEMSLVAVPTRDVAISLGILAASCFAAVWVAGRVYRVGLLMYGKRATLGEVLRWVRQSG